MQTPRFPSVLKIEENLKILLPTLVGALAFALSATAKDEPAETHGQLSEFIKRVEECKSEAKETFKLYVEKRGEKVVTEEFDGKVQCRVNTDIGRESRNGQAVTNDLFRKRPAFFNHRGENEIRDLGACRVVYTSIQDTYDHFRRIKENFCDNQEKFLTAFNQCGAVSKECLDDYKALRRVYQKYALQVHNDALASFAYIHKASLAAETARKTYEEDKEKLAQEFSKRSATEDPATVAAAVNTTPCLPGHPELRAINGGKTNCREYYDALSGTELVRGQAVGNETIKKLSARIIQEEVDAERKASLFNKKLQELHEREVEVVKKVSQRISDDIANIEKYGSIEGKKNTLLDKDNASALTGAASLAPAASKMLGQNGPAAALKDGAATVAAASSGAGPLDALAAVGAAGAGLGAGALANSMGKSSTAAFPSEAGNPVDFAAGKGVGEKGDKIVSAFDDGLASGGGGVRKNNTAKIEDGVHTEGLDAKVAEAAVGSVGGFGSASRSPSGSKKNAHSETNPAAEGLADSKGNDTANLFAGRSLDPKSSKPTTAANPGGDVANLLGQMKNLFNFDEGNPMGAGGAEGAGAGMAPSGSGSSMDASPLASAGSTPETEAPTEAGEEVAEAGIEPAAKADVQASPFGKVDTNLFTRVRARHHRCMERGLVLYGLRERVE